MATITFETTCNCRYGGQSNVVAMAAGSTCSLALRLVEPPSLGERIGAAMVAARPMYMPAKLKEVVAIGTGTDHCLALRIDGRVETWGAAFQNQKLVPADLINAVSVAGGYLNSIALRSDRTVIGWGVDSYEPRLAPEVTNVVALACGTASRPDSHPEEAL